MFASIVDAVRHSTYLAALEAAQAESERVREATTPAKDMPTLFVEYFLAKDRKSGYGVKFDGELIGVFSLVKGRGKDLIKEAVEIDGATKLDCFDGFLPEFYKQFGFEEYKREPNWTEGGPDVVYMRIPSAGDLSQ
jgi:hypothetical protein